MVHATSLAASIGLLLVMIVMIATAGPPKPGSRFYCGIAILGVLFACYFFATRVIFYNGIAKEMMDAWRDGKQPPAMEAGQNPIFVKLSVFVAFVIALCAFGALWGWLPPCLPSALSK